MAMATDVVSTERPLVVVIEDENDLRQLVVHNLRAEGFDALGAATAGEGLALCTMHRPAVVILDRMLDHIDGIVLCEHLRADAMTADAAILVLSARGSADEKETGFAAGVDDYVVKPFGIDDLLERVRALATLAARRQALRTTR